MTPGGRGDPSAPPLMPARRLSRTRSLMAANAYPDRVEVFWRYDAFTGDTWSAILSIHAANGRDVFGLSPDALERVRLQALGKWLAWTRAGKVVPEEVRGKAAMPAMSLVGKARQPRYASPPGSTDLTHATQGIGTSASTEAAIRSGNWSGGMTEAQLRAFATARAPAAVQSRPGAAYNRILSHVWGKPAGGASPIQPLMPKPVKPAAPKPAPKAEPRTFEEALNEAHGAGDRAGFRSALLALIREHAADAGTEQVHGMKGPAAFRVVEFGGIRWHFEPGTMGLVAHSLEDFLKRRESIPGRLAAATTAVYHTTGPNRHDDEWRARYRDFTVSSHTGGDGKIVGYSGYITSVRDFAHESGHNLATRLYGSTAPGGDYAKAIASGEPPVSDYAKNSPAEDFAEAARMYVMDRDAMRAKFPERFRVIDRIMKDQSYGG